MGITREGYDARTVILLESDLVPRISSTTEVVPVCR